MRTAKDIIEDYRKRGYDSFRLRAIAALRPEPMRTQILEMLDTESEEMIREDNTVETATDSQITPSLVMEMNDSSIMEAPVEAAIDSEKSDTVTETTPAEITVVSDIEEHDIAIAEAAAEEAVSKSTTGIFEAESEFWENESVEISNEQDEDFEPVAEGEASEKEPSAEEETEDNAEVTEDSVEDMTETEEESNDSAENEELEDSAEEHIEEGSEDNDLEAEINTETAEEISAEELTTEENTAEEDSDNLEEKKEAAEENNAETIEPAEAPAEEEAKEDAEEINEISVDTASIAEVSEEAQNDEQQEEEINSEDNEEAEDNELPAETEDHEYYDILAENIDKIDEVEEECDSENTCAEENTAENEAAEGGLQEEIVEFDEISDIHEVIEEDSTEEDSAAPENILTDEVLQDHLPDSEFLNEELTQEEIEIPKAEAEATEEEVNLEIKVSLDDVIEEKAEEETIYEAAAKELIEEWAAIQNTTVTSEDSEEDINNILVEAGRPAGNTADHQLTVLNKEENATEEETVEFPEDDHILYLFENVKKEDEDTIAETQLSLIKDNSAMAEDEWHDYGSGLIVFPKKMAEMHQAYEEALSDESIEERKIKEPVSEQDNNEITIEELVDAIETEQAEKTVIESVKAVDKLIEDIEESIEEGFVIESDMTTEEEHIEEETVLPEDKYNVVRQEIQELESSLNLVEESLTHKVKETEELAELVKQKDEIICLQNLQNEETYLKLSQAEKEIKEMSFSAGNMRELNKTIMNLRIEKDEIERERNILKSEVIPAFEEQQLSLVGMVEEEMEEKEKLISINRKQKRRNFASYSLATAATLCLALVPLLNWMSGITGTEDTAIQQPAAENIAIREESLRGKIEEQVMQIAKLENEKTSLHNSFINLKAEYIKKQSTLVKQVNLVREELAERKEEMAREYNELKQAYAVKEKERHQTQLVSSIASQQPQTRQAQERAAKKNVEYVVKSGDTLSEIVKRYYGRTGNGRLVKKVARANGLRNANDLRVHQKIFLTAINDD
ncbi:MAG: LysM peptidoglycan-binding domain-containing protein [Planctomycetota bacterium]|jgi:X-linked retinitis pigmentosa GTPase regulator